MTMQRLCHQNRDRTLLLGALNIAAISATIGAVIWPGGAAGGDSPAHNYPTAARVEFVNECIANQRDSLANVYQCSCVIDRIADQLSYDEFVEAITYSRYAGLPGEAGAIFRDSDEARQRARKYRELESEAYRACGLNQP